MRILSVLRSPVPPVGGRYMTKREAEDVTIATGIEYTTSAVIVGATDDGWTAFIAGCWHQEVILVSTRGDRPHGPDVVPCLSSPVSAAGRNLSQYEVLRLRRAGVSCSPLTFVRLLPDGSGASKWARGAWAPMWPKLVDAVPEAPGRRRSGPPEGCCCWACVVEGCKGRQS